MKVIFKNISLEFQRDATESLTFTNGYYVKTAENGKGSLADNAEAYYTGLVDITNFNTLKYKVYANTLMYGVAFYSEGVEQSTLVSHFLDTVSSVGDTNFTGKTLDLTAAKAAGAKFVILSHYGSSTVTSAYATLIP